MTWFLPQVDVGHSFTFCPEIKVVEAGKFWFACQVCSPGAPGFCLCPASEIPAEWRTCWRVLEILLTSACGPLQVQTCLSFSWWKSVDAFFEKSFLKSTLFHQTNEMMEEFSSKCEHLLLGFCKLYLPASCGCLCWRLKFLVWQKWVHHASLADLCFGKQDHIAPILQKLRSILNESMWMLLPIV